MNLKYIKAKKDDANMLIEIYNASFYDDFIKYGECPAYGRTRASMEESIEKYPKLIIFMMIFPSELFQLRIKGMESIISDAYA
jgi:hypothetical protein